MGAFLTGIGIICLIISFIVLNDLKKDGPIPSRGASKAMRRRARKRGISEGQAFIEWEQRKLKQLSKPYSPPKSRRRK